MLPKSLAPMEIYRLLKGVEQLTPEQLLKRRAVRVTVKIAGAYCK